MNSREKIRNFVRSLLTNKSDEETLADGDSLLTSGRLDSIDVLEIVVFLENQYGIDFSVRGFDQMEFDSINSIVNIIENACA